MLVVDNPRLLTRMLRDGSKPPLDIAYKYAAFCQGSKKMEELLKIFVAHGWGPSPPQSNADSCGGDSTSSDTASSEEEKSGPTRGDGHGDGDNDECWHDEDSLLHAVVLQDDDEDCLELLEEVLARGEEDTNKLSSSGYSPLAVAACTGSAATVKALLRAGASLDLKNPQNGCTALHASAAGGRVDTTKLLLATALSKNRESTIPGSPAGDIAPCSPGTECGASSASPPSRAAMTNTSETCPSPAVVDVMDDVGRRPLHIAATHNHVQVMEVLLGAGADIDSRDKLGGTPLFYATKEDNAEAVTALLKAGASPDIKHSSGYAALHVAMRRPVSGVAKALIAAGASPGVGGERGPTPLHIACESNARGTVEALLRAGAVPGHCWNDYLETPLNVACRCGSLNAVKLLLPHLSARQINMRNRTLGLDEGGETPLVAAIRHGGVNTWEKIEIVEAVSFLCRR